MDRDPSTNDLRPFPPGRGPSCPECDGDLVEQVGMASRTMMAGSSGYGDDGQRHNHDPNWSTSKYKCENGHTVGRRTRPSCPAKGCHFGGEEELSVIEK